MGLSDTARLRQRLAGKISWGDWLPVVRRLPGSDAVGLSYDDGPAEATPELLRVLRRHGAGATFFLNGQRAAAAPHLVERIVAEGHAVYAHGWEHVRYEAAPAEAIAEALERTEAVLRRFRPTPSPYLVRLPYGAGHMSARVHRAVRAWNPAAQIAHWELLTGDWALAEGCASAADLRQACAAAVPRLLGHPGLAGAVLLLHEAPFDVAAPLAGVLAPMLADMLLPALRQIGLRGAGMVAPASSPALRRFLRG